MPVGCGAGHHGPGGWVRGQTLVLPVCVCVCVGGGGGVLFITLHGLKIGCLLIMTIDCHDDILCHII